MPLSEKDIFLQKVGERLTTLRKQKGHSNHEAFADGIDMTRSQYWEYEKGIKNITVFNLKKVLDGLGVSFEEFFSDGF